MMLTVKADRFVDHLPDVATTVSFIVIDNGGSSILTGRSVMGCRVW